MSGSSQSLSGRGPTSALSTYENDTVGNVNVAAIIKLAEFYEV